MSRSACTVDAMAHAISTVVMAQWLKYQGYRTTYPTPPQAHNTMNADPLAFPMQHPLHSQCRPPCIPNAAPLAFPMQTPLHSQCRPPCIHKSMVLLSKITFSDPQAYWMQHPLHSFIPPPCIHSFIPNAFIHSSPIYSLCINVYIPRIPNAWMLYIHTLPLNMPFY